MLTERAPAKINVCLLLGPTRPSDGRHELVTVFQALDLHDELTAEDADDDEVVCAGIEGENLALTALRAFRAHTGWDGPGQRITITKRIPVAGGMAGGSADAAAALRLARRRSGIGTSETLRTIAATLGADVPAQVQPGRWFATGAGERLARVLATPSYGVLVVPVPEPLRTPDVFRKADELALGRDERALRAGRTEVRLHAGDLPREHCVNELAPAARALCPAIDVALDATRAAGADHVMVSGSGPTVLGFFDGGRAAAEAAAARIGRPAIATEPLR